MSREKSGVKLCGAAKVVDTFVDLGKPRLPCLPNLDCLNLRTYFPDNND